MPHPGEQEKVRGREMGIGGGRGGLEGETGGDREHDGKDSPGPGGVLPYISHIGMCCPKGYNFLAFLV